MQNDRNARTIIPELTRLARRHGYQRVTKVCKQAHGNIALLKDLLSRTFGDGGGSKRSLAAPHAQGNSPHPLC